MLARSLQDALESADAQTMQAVPNMLEIVPRGVNKVRQHLPDLQASSARAMFSTTRKSQKRRNGPALRITFRLVLTSNLRLVTASMCCGDLACSGWACSGC
jgi:hypothetical protein